MIGIFAATLLVFVLAMIGMAVGVLGGRRRLGAGCATLGPAGTDPPVCRACGRPADAGGCTDAALPSDTGMTEA